MIITHYKIIQILIIRLKIDEKMVVGDWWLVVSDG